MTKLQKWLCILFLFMAVWMGVYTETVPVSTNVKDLVFYSPIYLLIIFACYSLAIIGYRVATFNDCPEAEKELRQQILDARKDLKSKGFKFD